MKRIFTLLVFTCLASIAFGQYPTIWATKTSGDWANPGGDIWETFTGNATGTPGALGTGTTQAAGNLPSGTHFVYIRSGHTIVTSVERSVHSMTIEPTGKLWSNQSVDLRLKLLVGGTGFTYPQTGTITNNGTLGDLNDGLFLEVPGTNAANLTIGGSGVYQVRRLRVDGNASTLNLTIDANLTFTISSNYGFTIAYSPGASGGDNHTMTLNAGKTITIASGASYFHALSSASQTVPANGNYTYNIDGTLDFSASTVATYITPSSIAGKATTVNVGATGTMKLGAIFDATPGATSVGSVALNVASGGTLDATATTTMNTGANYFRLANNAIFKRTVGASDVIFPVGTSATNYNPVTINNSGAQDVFTVSLTNTVSNTGAMIDASKRVDKQWMISEAVAGGSNATLKLGWVTADQLAGFNTANPIVIGRWNGTAWDYFNATLSGTGTVADPYIATASGITANFTSANPFIVANKSALPVSFSDVKAYLKGKGTQVEWTVATESGITSYVIERSLNGKDFSSIGTVASKGNSTVVSNYSFFDVTPVAGVDYYRIKAVEKDGTAKFSAILKVNFISDNVEMNIAPNPVRSAQLNVQLSGLTKGNYTVRLYNNAGQLVFTDQVSAEGTPLSKTFALPATVKPGAYNLQITGGDIKLNKRVIVE